SMLARARQDHPGVTFIEADIARWRPPRPVDIFYSNAALHWLDGHDALIPDLLDGVKSGGWLAIQMPRNFGAPSHTAIVETIEQGPWRVKLESHLRRRPVADPQHYWRLLQGR